MTNRKFIADLGPETAPKTTSIDANLVLIDPDEMIDRIVDKNNPNTIRLRRAYRQYVEEMLPGCDQTFTTQAAKVCALMFLLQDACGVEDGQAVYTGVAFETTEQKRQNSNGASKLRL
jgi:hypothetical protein